MAIADTPIITESRRTSLKRWGSSQAIRIPKSMCDRAGISVGSELIMEFGSDESGPFVLVRPASSAHRSYADAPYVGMDEAFSSYEGDYSSHEADWGDDVGAEVVA